MYRTEQTQKLCAEADVMNEVLPTLLGFALAQLVNLVDFVRHWWVKPRLRIEEIGEGHVLLDHETDDSGEWLREMTYGFVVRNRVCKIARGVQAFLVEIEAREREGAKFQQVSAHTYALPWHGGKSDRYPAVLVPDARVSVELAGWLAGVDVVVPAIGTEEEYYREVWDGAAQFRFTVAVIEEMGEHACHTIVIDNPSAHRRVR